LIFLAQYMDIARFIQVFLVQGLSGLFFLYITYRILKRESKGLNLILSGSYLSVAFGVIINMIYAFILVESVVYILHFLTYYLLCLSLIFLLIFVLIVDKSDKVITPKIQLVLIITFGVLLLGLLFIPNGIVINQGTEWKPEWSWPFLTYSFIICSSIAIVPTTYYSLKLYFKFEYKELKKKWKYFLVGIFAYFFLYYGTSISNTLADPTFRLIWSLASLPTLFSLYFVYYGVAKQL